MADETFPFDSDENDEPDEGDTAPQVDENKSFKAIRDAAKRSERQLKSQEKELERLKAFEAEVLGERKEKAINSVFTEVGLNPKQAELFKRANPDLTVDAVTADAVKAFAAEFELITSAGEAVDAPEPEKPQGFTPVTTGTAAPAAIINADDIEGMLKSGDLEGVRKAFEAGRVNKEAPWAKYQG